MVMRAMDLAENELRVCPGLERKLGDQLRQLVPTEGTLPELFSVLSKCIRNGAFDASEELYAYLRLVVAFKLRETNPPRVRGKLGDSLDRLLSDSSSSCRTPAQDDGGEA
jgi:hypothetical protein